MAKREHQIGLKVRQDAVSQGSVPAIGNAISCQCTCRDSGDDSSMDVGKSRRVRTEVGVDGVEVRVLVARL